MIKRDDSLYNEFYPLWLNKRKDLLALRELSKIKEIDLHHTEGGGNWAGLKKWMLSKTNKRRSGYKRGVGLFHYCIEKCGDIYNTWPLIIPVFHSCSGLHDLETIGIEIIHLKGEFKEKQYKSLIDLLFNYLFKVLPNLERIVTHDYNYQKYKGKTKGCPSKDFEFKRLTKYLRKKNIPHQTNNINIIDFTMKNKDIYTYKKSDSKQRTVSTRTIEGKGGLIGFIIDLIISFIRGKT